MLLLPCSKMLCSKLALLSTGILWCCSQDSAHSSFQPTLKELQRFGLRYSAERWQVLLAGKPLCLEIFLLLLLYCGFLKPLFPVAAASWCGLSVPQTLSCSGCSSPHSSGLLNQNLILLVQHPWPGWRSAFLLSFSLVSISLSIPPLSFGRQVVSRVLHPAGPPAPGAVKEPPPDILLPGLTFLKRQMLSDRIKYVSCNSQINWNIGSVGIRERNYTNGQKNSSRWQRKHEIMLNAITGNPAA